MFNQRAHPAQVPFPFFADVARQDDGFVVRMRDSARAARQATSAASPAPLSEIPGASSCVPAALHVHVGARGKNSVEMSSQQDHAFGIVTRALGDHVAKLVDVNIKTG